MQQQNLCSFIILVLSIVLLGHASVPPKWDNATTCIDHAWWALVPVDRSLLLPLLPSDIQLGPLPDAYRQIYPSDSHPVLFEFGRQNNCRWKYFPVSTTFTEFKMEIPYCQHASFGEPFMFKPIIYVDNELDRWGSKHVFGLNTLAAVFNLTEGQYSFTPSSSQKLSDDPLEAIFHGVGDFSNDVHAFPFFQEYIDINDHPWFCKNALGQLKCAMDYYDWNNMKIRPAIMELAIYDDNVLPVDGDYPMIWRTAGIDQPLGTVEVIVPLGISNPNECPVQDM